MSKHFIGAPVLVLCTIGNQPALGSSTGWMNSLATLFQHYLWFEVLASKEVFQLLRLLYNSDGWAHLWIVVIARHSQGTRFSLQHPFGGGISFDSVLIIVRLVYISLCSFVIRFCCM